MTKLEYKSEQGTTFIFEDSSLSTLSSSSEVILRNASCLLSLTLSIKFIGISIFWPSIIWISSWCVQIFVSLEILHCSFKPLSKSCALTHSISYKWPRQILPSSSFRFAHLSFYRKSLCLIEISTYPVWGSPFLPKEYT